MVAGLVSILLPAYNEEEFVGTLLRRVAAAALPGGLRREIIVVDDGSTDDTTAEIERAASAHPGLIRVIRHERNLGKGAAVRTALKQAQGEYCLIQDADLEYNPNEYRRLLEPLADGVADVVYGSRFVTSDRRRVLYFWHSVANRVLTTLCNLVADVNLTDMATGYKAFRTSLVKSIPLRCDRFGFEPEITIKLARRQARMYEVPISYEGRTYEDGKKISWRDAVKWLFVILRFGLVSDIYVDRGAGTLDALSVAPRFNVWMAETIRPYVGQTVLEIGAGVGNLTRTLIRRRTRYVATDVESEHLVRLERRLQHCPTLETALCDLACEADFSRFQNAFDTVVCLNVLEHVEQEAASIRNIYSALAPGGRAIVLTPQGQEIYGTLDVELGHVRRYSEAEMRTRFEAAGFIVERILRFNRVSRPGWYVTGKVLKRTKLSRMQLRLFDRMVWLWRRIDRFLPWPSTSLIAIAVKPEVQRTGDGVGCDAVSGRT